MSESNHFEATKNFYSGNPSEIKKVECKSVIESYSSFTLRLCMKWADTYNNSDKNIEEYMTGSLLALIESADKNLEDLKKKNEAGEELEFLIEMLKANCRHNTYKLT